MGLSVSLGMNNNIKESKVPFFCKNNIFYEDGILMVILKEETNLKTKLEL